MATADAEAGMTFPAIAASATIRNRRNSVQIEIRGFSNPAMTLAASQITGKELNVETFAQFSAVQEQLVALSAAPETQKSVERLGSIAPAERTEIASVAIVTLALQQISLGASCNYAKTRLRTVPASEPQPDVARLAATYVDLTGVCSDARPSSLQQVSARQHLYGMRIQ
jgi:predicted metalloprotease with PDZ domain